MRAVVYIIPLTPSLSRMGEGVSQERLRSLRAVDTISTASYQIGGPLRDHHGRRIGVAVDDLRHY